MKVIKKYDIINFKYKNGGIILNVSYNNLWKLLIDKNMKKKDLREMTGISTASMAKLGKNKNVNMEILIKICEALECNISDIMEIKSNEVNE